MLFLEIHKNQMLFNNKSIFDIKYKRLVRILHLKPEYLLKTRFIYIIKKHILFACNCR
jgi:hypothetical protein